MSTIDDMTLSSYLDGELDYAHANEVTSQIHGHSSVQKRFLALATSQALLRAYGQTEARKEVPQHLISTLHAKKKSKLVRMPPKTIFQIAAVCVLFLSSYLVGRHYNIGPENQPSLVPVIPTSLAQTINEVLEYEKSGSEQSWVELAGGGTARVTPVKTFRGAEGKYYRMYLIDLSGEEEGNRHFWAMASREGKENWETKGVFTGAVPGNI
jgi:hypothetical protein